MPGHKPVSSKKAMVVENKNRTQITLIGDSTIDNRVWVRGLLKSYARTQLGFKDSTKAAKSNMSVVENLRSNLPDHDIHDYTNDGFTTTDCLRGNMRDKVFGKGRFTLFPHEYFHPLIEGEENIKKSQHIIVSIGGNDFREFLVAAKQKSGKAQEEYIKENLGLVLETMKRQYIEIIQHIRSLNSDAQLILMTQYYPSASQNSYQLYKFMRNVGEALNLGGPTHDPMNVIHDIMKMTYSDILKSPELGPVVVADVTSSLNLFDNKNHVHQIEPSHVGGKKIAKMLSYMITNKNIAQGHAYRFYPDFFTTESDQHDKHIEKTAIQAWMPAHPYDLRDGYTRREEKIYRKYQEYTPDELLVTLNNAIKKYDVNSPIYKAGLDVLTEGMKLSKSMPARDLKKWGMSIVLAINVLNHPKQPDALQVLQNHATMRAIGKADKHAQLKGSLVALAGILILSISFISLFMLGSLPFMGIVAVLGGAVGIPLLVSGGTFFSNNSQKSLSKKTEALADKVSQLAL